MLTWDEEVKPTSPVPVNSGSTPDRQVSASPEIPQAALRTLDDGAVVPVAKPVVAAAKPVAVVSHRRVKVLDGILPSLPSPFPYYPFLYLFYPL